jgi:hypothetical protein
MKYLFPFERFFLKLVIPFRSAFPEIVNPYSIQTWLNGSLYKYTIIGSVLFQYFADYLIFKHESSFFFVQLLRSAFPEIVNPF